MLLAPMAQDAWAQTAPPVRVRGTIASLAGDVLTINSRDGQVLKIALPATAGLSYVKKADKSDIKVGTFIGTANRVGADGTRTALEILVFPEAARGTGEGDYPWDLEPGSMMTNGTIKGSVTAASGEELSIAFKDSSNKVIVPPNIPIVTVAKADRSDLKPGEKVFLVASKGADGALTALRVNVGKDGVSPPM
jgi:hypothetical protein